jgi:uncharacterized membrane protein
MNEFGPPTQAQPRAAHQRWVLSSHRSLGRKGFMLLMVLLCGISFVAGVVFSLAGAWPVAGFFGLDVLLVWIAFRMNYRSGRRYETVDLDPDALVITRVAPSGRQQAFTFNPYWVRVQLDEAVDGRTRLKLALRGRAFTFGRGLNDDERREFAQVLSGALAQTRSGGR